MKFFATVFLLILRDMQGVCLNLVVNFNIQAMLLRDFTDPFKGKSGIYHFSMPRLEKDLLFTCDADFVAGVNYLAVTSVTSPVSLLCYCLMNNHFHTLLAGCLDDCVEFHRSYIRRLISYVSKKRGIKGLLHLDLVDVQAVTSTKQLKNEVLYILRNPYKARICSPLSYKWSSANVYFTEHKYSFTPEVYTARILRNRLMSKGKVGGKLSFNGNQAENKSFVDYRYVEEKIGNSLEYFDIMRLYDLESSVELSHGIEESVIFNDEELLKKACVICQTEFHAESIGQLGRKELLLLARSLSRRFGAKKKQLGRILGLDDDVLDRIL